MKRFLLIFTAAVVCLLAAPLPGADALGNSGAKIKKKPTTFVNPINIGHQYITMNGTTYRSSADPIIIEYKGDYYLFASAGGGYWWSPDLVNWNFVYNERHNSWAPGAFVHGGALYVCYSVGTIQKSTDPKKGEWELIGRPDVWPDPEFFVDDD
ncbi:MAG: hypothetical protein FWF03_06390, partial [Defluviitaleaceae bacterium]|nr:hypothetical protein [Defluviitaleaceae bacterium]